MSTKLLDRGALALGIVAGLCAGTIGFLLLDSASFTFVEDRGLLGAIIGGGISGLATLLATLVANYFLVRKTFEDRRAELESLAFSAFWKINPLRDDMIKHYQHYFDGSHSLALHISGRGSLQKPLRNHRRVIEFSDAEKALGLKLGRASVFNDIVDAQSLADSFYFLTTE